MATCEQSSGQTILQHGESVAAAYKDMYCSTAPQGDWYFSPELLENRTWLKSLCPPDEVMEQYHIFHDCGKPSCLQLDAEGRRHFPCHAMVSAREWLIAGGDPFIGRLIEHDMDMHTLKPADAATYRHLDITPALLLTAWAELNANSIMFGGQQSTSFKIKAKSLTKLTRAFITILKEQS